MYFDDFSGHYQSNSITIFSLIASKCYKQILKSLKRLLNIKYIGSNYTISRSTKFGVNFQIGTGSGFEHARGTPLPISKASTPPPPGGTDRAGSIPSAPGQSIQAQDCVRQSHDRVQMAVSQLARGIDTILFYRWPTVYEVGPALKQHWVNASC